MKAFSDQPEYFTTGMFPLQTVMKELHLRNVHLYPRLVPYIQFIHSEDVFDKGCRFHQRIQEDLERRRADIVELHQPLSPTMMDVHTSIVECMIGTLSELKRSNTSVWFPRIADGAERVLIQLIA